MNNNIGDERQTMIRHKVSRNGLIVSIMYLIGMIIYNRMVLKEPQMNAYLFIYSCFLIAMIIISYVGVTKNSGMKFMVNFKYIKTDELEKDRLNKVLSITGMCLVFAAIIALLSKILMDVPKVYQKLDMYLIGVYGMTMIISSTYYKDFMLPNKVDNVEEFLNNKSIRVKRYAKDALKSTVAWTFIGQTLLRENVSLYTSNVYINAFIYVFIRFVVFFILDFILGEVSVKKSLELEREMEE